MEYARAKQLNSKLYFTIPDFASVLRVRRESARVLCSRYVKKGEFIRLKNNFYLTAQKWDTLNRVDCFKLANFLQVPSYVSFMSALGEYEITTQVTRNLCESTSVRRSVCFSAGDRVFKYYKLKKELYFGFEKKGGYFLALPEKALLDALYLYSLGKYTFDLSAIDAG